MGNVSSNTEPVWTITGESRGDWLKKHSSDAQLVKKFGKFEKSVTQNPVSNRDVIKLKPPLSDTYEYKKPPVRGLYTLDHSNAEINLVDFNWKGNVRYK